MKVLPIQTSNPHVHLIEPNIERDAPLSVQWLQGEHGRTTLRLMGVSNSENQPSSLEQEKNRVAGFISNEDQLNWMIAVDDKVVGSIWVDLVENNSVPPPSIHMMIGDPSVRNQGIGTAVSTAVIDYLKELGYSKIYSRHLIDNERVAHMLSKIGFANLGNSYKDQDNLHWQTVSLLINHES